MKRANGRGRKATFVKYALLALVGLSVGIVSCENGLSAQKEPARIRFCRESYRGFSGEIAVGAYIDIKGSMYQVTSPRTRRPNTIDHISDSLAIWVLSEGVLQSNTVPKDSLLLMDSLLGKAKSDTEFVQMAIGNDIGVCNWFAFDPESISSNNTPLLLKRTGSTEYRLVSEPAVRLTVMIDRYCKISEGE